MSRTSSVASSKVLVSLVSLLWLAACPGTDGRPAGTDEAEQLPSLKVDLPPPPSFDKPRTPITYPDQSLSVYGVRKKLHDYLDREVRVKAYLVDVYACPCPKGKTTDTCTCELPHFWIADEPGEPKDKALLIADMPFDDLGKKMKLDLTIGAQVVVSGTFARQSNTGFASSEGLIIYRAHAPAEGAAAAAPPPPAR